MAILIQSIAADKSVAVNGEQATFTAVIKNTSGSMVKNVAFELYATDGIASAGADALAAVGPQGVSVGARSAKTVSFTVTLNLTQTWIARMQTRRAAILTLMAYTSSEIAQLDVPDFYLLDARYNPRISEFTVERTSDESEQVKSTIRLSLAAGLTAAQQGRMAFSLKADAADIPLNRTLAQLLTGVTDDAGAITAAFDKASAHRLTLSFGDAYESVTATLDVSRAFANLHLSGMRTGGACFGGFCLSTENDPKLETHYPLHAYAGIANFQGGRTEQITVPGNGYIDVGVTFGNAFAEAPIIMVCAESGSTAGDFGGVAVAVLEDSVTANGFLVRAFNSHSTARKPYVRWLAYGAPT